ncbi:TetR family transcriptional regulator [Hydrogenophaga sp. A37]|uniref:TetR/AcrR family transcriptional regulator n=1 Tax=Hydrogenophaga sp. A37 TaxID=1945864 RepID=UPI0009D21412|nr:TetR/AcrR family transcriptional regulator [Hydrogenophaga sp. A37]OOG78966.1 TetR family transcriptional regulator [Hydrogenophaga sp. A37]
MPAIRKPQPSLLAKKQPAQQRATETYERILEVTAQTLADVGIERLSTNLVCERAGLTPPALYRYFPNKYALLSELGQRLMQAQNERVDRWITLEVFSGGVDSLERAIEGLIVDTYEATVQTVGGVWIMRALRAVPALQQVRLASHAAVTQQQTQLLAQALPEADAAELQLVSRIVVELIYATVEMIFDEPLDVKAVARTVAGMIASHLTRVRPQAASVKRRPARKVATRL